MTWALILAGARQIVRESNSVRGGGWQTSIGRELDGKVLGVLGLGNIGGEVARIGRAFGMKVIAWSQNMTPQIAEAAGATFGHEGGTVPSGRCGDHPPHPEQAHARVLSAPPNSRS